MYKPEGLRNKKNLNHRSRSLDLDPWFNLLMRTLIMRHVIAGHAVNTTYTDGGSADIGYVHGWTVVGQRICTGRTVVG